MEFYKVSNKERAPHQSHKRYFQGKDSSMPTKEMDSFFMDSMDQLLSDALRYSSQTQTTPYPKWYQLYRGGGGGSF